MVTCFENLASLIDTAAYCKEIATSLDELDYNFGLTEVPVHVERALIAEAMDTRPYGVSRVFKYYRYGFLLAWRPNRQGQRIWQFVFLDRSFLRQFRVLPDRLAYHLFRSERQNERLKMLLAWDHASHAKARRLGIQLPTVCWDHAVPQQFVWHATAPVCYVHCPVSFPRPIPDGVVATPEGWGQLPYHVFKQEVLTAPAEDAINKALKYARKWKSQSRNRR